uniref:Uncharacterized protein n=1 Tax=Erpetoichthys calabaricus TaxID=27687 RepID=A0A8C4RM68_ERPCA
HQEEEKRMARHHHFARMHAKLHGHEAMCAEMVLILINTPAMAQLLLVQRKRRHPNGEWWVLPSFIQTFHLVIFQ